MTTIADMLKKMEWDLATKLNRHFNLNEVWHNLYDDPCLLRQKKLGFYCWIEENGRRIASSSEECIDNLSINTKYTYEEENLNRRGRPPNSKIDYDHYIRQMFCEVGKFLAITQGSDPGKNIRLFINKEMAIYPNKSRIFYAEKQIGINDKIFVSPEAMKEIQEWDSKIPDQAADKTERKINFREFL